MTMPGRSAAPNRLTAGRFGLRGAGAGRRIATIACLSGLAAVALIGILHPLTVAGGGQPGATDALAASSSVGSVWSGGDPTGGVNWIDLITKATIVLALLFITLRVLGRVGAGTPKRGGRLEVLESRALAPKASLHLVAIGDRRLVVGLTPSGMVSLAELDAAELDTDEVGAAFAEPSATDGVEARVETRGAAVGANRAPQPTLGTALNYALGPLDALTGRLALFLNGGRVR
jgi:flagellar biosynthetic protein FliO